MKNREKSRKKARPAAKTAGRVAGFWWVFSAHSASGAGKPLFEGVGAQLFRWDPLWGSSVFGCPGAGGMGMCSALGCSGGGLV